MIADEFPSQGSERHLSAGTQMAGDPPYLQISHDSNPSGEAQRKNIKSLKDTSKPLDTTNIVAMPNLQERLQRVLKGK